MDPDDLSYQCIFCLNQFCMNYLPSSLISPNMNLQFNHPQSTQSLSLLNMHTSLLSFLSSCILLNQLISHVWSLFFPSWLLQLGASLIFPFIIIPSSFMDCPQLGISLPFSLLLFFTSFQGALTFAQAALSGFQPSRPFFFSQLRLGFPQFVRLNNLN